MARKVTEKQVRSLCNRIASRIEAGCYIVDQQADDSWLVLFERRLVKMEREPIRYYAPGEPPEAPKPLDIITQQVTMKLRPGLFEIALDDSAIAQIAEHIDKKLSESKSVLR